MTILMINDNFKIVGGAERYFYNLAKLLRANGHNVFTLTFDDFERSQNNDFVLKQYQNKFGQFFAHRFISFRYFKIRKIVRRIDPDIIHLHNIYENRYSILLASWNYKTVQTANDLNIIFPGYLKIFSGNKNSFLLKSRALWQRLIKNIFISRFLAPSDFIKDEMIKYGYQQVSKLPHFFEPLSPKRINNHQEPLVLYSGRLIKGKGIGYLAEVFKLLSANKNLKLIVAGNGPEKYRLDNLAQDNSQITLTGWLPAGELKKLYARADVLVITSAIPESFCLVAAEALSNFLPVVAFDVGGINELIKDGYNGFLVKVGDVKNMTEKINLLLKNRALAEKFSLNIKNSLSAADNPYSRDSHYRQLINIYEKSRNNLPANY